MTDHSKRGTDIAAYAVIAFDHRKQFVVLEHITPNRLDVPFHFHPSIEINFLTDCDMTYSFSGEKFLLKRGHFCVFWAARPHRPLKIEGQGKITNAYVDLAEFLRWPLPKDFVKAVLQGEVVSSKSEIAGDNEMAARWSKEIEKTEPEWQRLHVLELQARIHRLAIDGWNVLLKPQEAKSDLSFGGDAIDQVAKMLQFIAEHFANQISLSDVAAAAETTQNTAMSLFKKILKRTIKEYITDMRVFQAQVLLAETDKKILTIALDCGFGSQSTFYAAFQSQTGNSPAGFRTNARQSSSA